MPASSWQLPRRSPRSTSLPHSPKSPKPPLRTRTLCQISWRVSTTPASPLVPACMSVSCENRMATSSHQCRKPSSNASAAACSHRPLIAIRTDFAPQLALHHRHCQRPDTPNNPPKRRWRRTTNQPTPMQRRPPKRRRRRTTNQPAPTRTGMTRPWRLPHCERVKQQFPEAPGVAAGDVDADAEPTHPHLTHDPAPPDPQPPATQRGLAAASAEAGVRQGLASLDAVDLQATCRQRVFTLQSAPARIRGALRTAMRTGLRLAVHPVAPEDALRGWKLFCLAPRMFLFRSPGASRIPSTELERRCELFRAGHWPDLLRQSASAAAVPPSPRRGDPSDAQRARRAAALVRLGELSAAGHALTAQPLAAGSSDTLAELRDPARRPPAPYAPLPEPVLQHAPAEACPLPLPAFLRCLRSARRGSEPGPSGATNEHIRILLDDDEDARLLHGAAVRLANADVPPEVLEGIRVGRLVALRKPNGRVRALVIGDVLRRLVGRVLAQHFAPHLQQACMPHQFGLSTRAGTEAVSRLRH